MQPLVVDPEVVGDLTYAEIHVNHASLITVRI
jgi:hypothetical protein